jgi:Fic family protein
LRVARKSMEDGQPLSKLLIRQMHQLLLSFVRGQSKNPGQFKTEQNYVGTRGSSKISFVPVSPEQLESGMDQLLGFTENHQWPALLRVAISHLEFEALHPFKDGNGRVGRMLVTLLFWQLGCIAKPHFYISRFFEEHKADYLHHMREVSASGAWENWCIFFLTAVKEQAFQNLEVAESTRNLYEEMKGRFAELLNSAKAVTALDYVFTNPVFRNSRFTQHAGIPQHTAARFSRLLLEEGLLVPIREAAGRQSAIYSFEPLLQLVRI